MAVALLAAPTLPGCVDGAALLHAQQEEVSRVSLEEIDIGKFRITLPRAPGGLDGGVVEFHAFGHVRLRDRDRVSAALALNSPETRYRVLMLVRSLTGEQLEEPNLQTLRNGLVKIVNAALEKHQIKDVGFSSFAFTAA